MSKEIEENEIRVMRNGKVEVVNFQEVMDAFASVAHEESVNKATDAVDKDVFQEVMEKPVSEKQLQKESQHPSVLDGGDYEALVGKLADIIVNEVEKNNLDLGILLGDVVVLSTKWWLGEGYYVDGADIYRKLWQKYELLYYNTQAHLADMSHHVDYFFKELQKLWWPKKESDKNKK